MKIGTLIVVGSTHATRDGYASSIGKIGKVLSSERDRVGVYCRVRLDDKTVVAVDLKDCIPTGLDNASSAPWLLKRGGLL